MQPKHDSRSPFATLTNPNPGESVEGPVWLEWLTSWGEARESFIEFLDAEIARMRSNYAHLIEREEFDKCRTNAGYELALSNLRNVVKQFETEKKNHAEILEKRGPNRRLRID